MAEIRNEEEYLAHFPADSPSATKCSRALELSLDTRKFEIELYWKRAAYFWTLIAAAFGGYFALSGSGKSTNLIFLVSCLGFLLSLGWYLVNRGSKYWQENWERHVDILVSRELGPLYATTISDSRYPFIKFWRGYRYSVSRINQLISLFVVFVWGGLAIVAFPVGSRPECLLGLAPWFLATATVIFAILLLCLGKSGSQTNARLIDFRVAPLSPAEDKSEEA